MNAADFKRAFDSGLQQRFVDWAKAESLRLDDICSMEVDHDKGVPVFIVNLADGRRRAFPFQIPKLH